MKRAIFYGYTCVLFGMTIFSYAFVDPNFFYLRNPYRNIQFDHRQLITAIYILFIVALFACYFFFIKMYTMSQLSIKEIKWLIGLTIVGLIFSYPAMLSYDIFNYMATARVTYFYKENPYVVMPIEFTGDPLLQFTHAANKVALYGSVWILLTFFPYLLGSGSYLATMFIFKVFIVVFFVATVWLLLKITNEWYSTLLFALNPLVVIETFVSGHNDIVMMFFALFSFYFLHSKRRLVGLIFLVLSILIKYATVFLVPVFLYVFWQQYKGRKIHWKKTAFLSGIAMFTIFLLSPIREEMYPWYFIWPFAFSVFLFKKKILIYSMIALSAGLMLRYTPFMLFGTHFGSTPLIKILVTFVPLGVFLLFFLLRQKTWQNIFSH